MVLAALLRQGEYLVKRKAGVDQIAFGNSEERGKREARDGGRILHLTDDPVALLAGKLVDVLDRSEVVRRGSAKQYIDHA